METTERGAAELFDGEGEMYALCRATEWGATPLGPVEEWPAALRIIVRSCLDSAFPVAVWCEPEQIAIYNDSYRRILGLKHPWALGRPYREVWSEIWQEVEPLFAQIRAGGPPVYAEDAPFVLHRDAHDTNAKGEPNAWFTFSLSAVREEDGRMVALVNLAWETTSRIRAERGREAARQKAERAEAHLRDMFEQAPAFMAVLRGPAHVFEYANEAYYTLVGRRDLIGRPVIDALPEVRGQGFEEVLTDVLETGQPFVGRELEVFIARSPGEQPERRYVDFIYYPLTEANRQRSGVVAHGYDVTDHVLTRQEAHRARQDAELANQAKSQFLANMSHEIRTPINAIMGYTDLLDAGVGGTLTPPQQDYVDRVRASSQHLLNLVNDVLDLSKIEAGEMRMDVTECSVDVIAERALHMIAPQAEAKSLVLRHESAGGDLAFIGDEDRVRQIILNLLSNAVKFTEAGGAITVRCMVAENTDRESEQLGPGPWVSVLVEDTGRGIPESEHARIFEPFVQAAYDRRAPRVGGTGLGLTISRRFARLMDGDLTVRSTVGQGSCFTLWLPRAKLNEGSSR
jgi:PAS domain S-box-containing protein